MERQLAAPRGAGISHIGIVRGYLGQQINVPEVTYFENVRWAETNMVMSLASAATWLRVEPAIISYADIFYRSTVVRDLGASNGELVVAYDRNWRALWRRRFADPLSDAETFRTDQFGKLLEIGKRAADISEIEGQYMGLMKITPKAWLSIK